MTIFRQIKSENKPMKLSTKAQNLDVLQKLRLQKSVIPKFFKYTVEEWILDKDRIIKVLLEKLNKKR